MEIFTPTELSDEVKAQIEANKIASFNKDILDNMITNYESAFMMFWNNPNTTTQAICDRFGNKAYQLFAASDAIRQLIVQMRPSYTAPVVPFLFTINQDGTVTIGDIVHQP